MELILQETLERLKRGETVRWAMITAQEGSVPRGAGTKMAVFAGGTFAGTVGGGAMEYWVQEQAAQRTCSGILVYDSCGGELSCGGRRTLLLLCLDETDLPALEQMQTGEGWLVCRKETGWKPEFQAAGDYPAEIFWDGERYTEPLRQQSRLILFGAGHVAQALFAQMELLGFEARVYDDRPELLNLAVFHGAAERADFSELGTVPMTGRDFVCIMTRSHETDYLVLRQVLRKYPAYVGMLGSRGKTAWVQKKLEQDGFPETERSGIHMPIGLKIGAETPAEIAVSIAAELIQCRAEQKR